MQKTEKSYQQKQMHFDFQVEDVPMMTQKAESLGTLRAGEQFGGNDFITMIDPAGHPNRIST